MATVTGLTIEDFERLPEVLARNHELVDGELVEVSGSKPKHNFFRDYLIELLKPYARDRQLGIVVAELEFDFDGNAYSPDISFISKPKQSLINEDLRVQRFVPDLAIEIVSTNDTLEGLAKKVDHYRHSGTGEVWIFCLNPVQVFVYSKGRRAILDEKDEFRPETIPGFAMPIADLLRNCR